MDSTIRLNTKGLGPGARFVLGVAEKKKKMNDLTPLEWAWTIQSMINTCEAQSKYFPLFKPLLRDKQGRIYAASLKKCRDRYYVKWEEKDFFLSSDAAFILLECVALCDFAPKSVDGRPDVRSQTKAILYSKPAGVLFEYDRLTQLIRPLLPDDLAKIIEEHKHVAIRLIYAWTNLTEIATQKKEEHLNSVKVLSVFCGSVINRIDTESFDPVLMDTYVAG